MRTEPEVRAALVDLMYSLVTGLVPPEAKAIVFGEIEALRYVLGEEPSGDNMAAMLDAVRSWRVEQGR